MSPVRLRYDQCCSSDGCMRPARHDDLCPSCYAACGAARRAVADLVDSLSAPAVGDILERMASDLAELDGVADLEVLWGLPVIEPKRWAA